MSFTATVFFAPAQPARRTIHSATVLESMISSVRSGECVPFSHSAERMRRSHSRLQVTPVRKERNRYRRRASIPVRNFPAVRRAGDCSLPLGSPGRMRDPSALEGRIMLTQSPAWKALQQHHEQVRDVQMRALFAQDPQRFDRFSLRLSDLLVDYSKHRVTEETLRLLF